MIFSQNNKPTLSEFCDLLKRSDALLNKEAVGRENYYAKNNSGLLEQVVCDALRRCAVGTPFENTIELVSGISFPDIVAGHHFGVEVKSTISNSWKSVGSSIHESTRNADVKRIFLTFCKLSRPAQFLSRPYEECLSEISVTHYPRYQIDMELPAGETIFDKLGIPYDKLREMENPVAPVSRYYKSRLQPGQSLWWAADDAETAAPPILRLWTTLTTKEKNTYTAQGYALFPEILAPSSSAKYQRFALWLATNCSIINTNIRDQFSAGGKTTLRTSDAIFENVPAVFGRIQKHKRIIEESISAASEATLKEYWEVEQLQEERTTQWIEIAAAKAAINKLNYNKIKSMLIAIFH